MNIRQWNYKYKVAFALLDSKGEPVKVFVDEQTDLSQWLKGEVTGEDDEINVTWQM